MPPQTDVAPINVVLASDSQYAMAVSVTIASVIANYDDSRALRFYILDGGMDSSSKRKIETSVLKQDDSGKVFLHWLTPDLSLISKLKLSRGYQHTSATYLRLLIPHCLPESCAKAIYLDCDLLVRANIGELWDTSLDGCAVLAAQDHIRLLSGPNVRLKPQALGASSSAKYFNSGVMVMDLDKWRRERIAQRTLQFIDSRSDEIVYFEQCGMNAVLFNDWKELDQAWNWQIASSSRRRRSGMAALGEPTGQRLSELRVIHYAGMDKPWKPGSALKWRKEFYSYLEATSWKGWRPSLASELRAWLRPSILVRNCSYLLKRTLGA